MSASSLSQEQGLPASLWKLPASSLLLPEAASSPEFSTGYQPSSFLRPPPKTAAIAQPCSSKAGSELFKSTAGILIIHVKHALLANDSLKLSELHGVEQSPASSFPWPGLGAKPGSAKQPRPSAVVAQGHLGEEHPGRSVQSCGLLSTQPIVQPPAWHLAPSRPGVSAKCFYCKLLCPTLRDILSHFKGTGITKMQGNGGVLIQHS